MSAAAADIRRVLVTGATGFIGGHLVRRLAARGHEVHSIVRAASDPDSLRELETCSVPHFHDGTTEGMIGLVGKARPEVVFHLASLFIAEHKAEQVEPLIRSNVLFPAQLLEAMASHDVRRLVNVGTLWQHYHGADYSPVCLYAATKQAFETLLQFYAEARGFRATTLKFYDTYGPLDRRPKLFSVLRRIASTGETLAMSPGEQLIDLIYVDDVVDALLIAYNRLFAESSTALESFALSSGAPVSLRQLVSTFAEVTGKRVDVRWGGRPYRSREVMIPDLHGQILPGWKPQVALRTGIRLSQAGNV